MGVRIRNDRIRNERWRECDLCGGEYPVSMMWKRNGRIVCRERCEDEDLLAKEEPVPKELMELRK